MKQLIGEIIKAIEGNYFKDFIRQNHAKINLLSDKDFQTIFMTISEKYIESKNTLSLSLEKHYLSFIEYFIATYQYMNHLENDQSILMLVSAKGQLLTLNKLLENKNINLNLKNSSGKTALIIAVEHNQIHIVNKLLHAGALSYLRDIEGNTAFLKAIELGHQEIIQLFLNQYPPKFNIRNKSGKSAINIALECHHEKIALELLSHELFQKNITDELKHIHLTNYPEFIIPLMQAGMQFNKHQLAEIKELFNLNPLHLAIFKRKINLVYEAIKNGVSIEETDAQGRNPLRLAIDTKQPNIEKALIGLGAQLPSYEEPCFDNDLIEDKPCHVFNPHRHFKIWLSNNPAIFMNEENKLRLIKMREKASPQTKIRLIYDNRLLNLESQKQLHQFCKKMNIIAIDIETDIKPLCHKQDRALLELYEDEIFNLHNGGNLAAASDILRWITPIMNFGVYSDLDIDIQTKYLPKTIHLYEDVVFNLGISQKTPSSMININLNNDILIFANPNTEKISEVKQSILNSYQKKTVIEWIYITFPTVEYLEDVFVKSYCLSKSSEFKNQLSPIEFRKELPSILNHFLESVKSSYPDIQNEALETFHILSEKLYINSIIKSSGPDKLSPLIKDIAMDDFFVNDAILPFSLSSYPSLFKAFHSTQACQIQTSKDHQNEKLAGDLSWTAEGQLNMFKRDDTLKYHSQLIQKSYQFFKEKSTALSKKEKNSSMKTKGG